MPVREWSSKRSHEFQTGGETRVAGTVSNLGGGGQ